MKRTTIDTIVFDLGGVLIDWNPRHLFRKIFDHTAEMEYFLREVCTSDWNEQQDAGRPLAEATAMLIERFPNYKLQIHAYYGRWEEMLGGAIEKTVTILEALHRQQSHRLYALTNWSHETFPIARQRFPFLDLFENILVSGEVKLKKPDPKIYQLLFDRFAIDPAKAIFIDDSLRNVDAAGAAGLHTIHFKSPQQLQYELEARDMLMREE